MHLHTVIHDLILTFPEDSQGGEGSYVVVPAQVHVSSAINLQSGTTLCLSRCQGDVMVTGNGGMGGAGGGEGGPTAFASSWKEVYGVLINAKEHWFGPTGQGLTSALPENLSTFVSMQDNEYTHFVMKSQLGSCMWDACNIQLAAALPSYPLQHNPADSSNSSHKSVC